MQFHSFDAAYVERLRTGDCQTEKHFISYFTKLIQIKCRSRFLSPERSEDARQETFARFYSALYSGKILKPECLGSFVNSTCNYVLNEGGRKNEKFESLEAEDGKEREFPDEDAVDVLNSLESKDTEKRVREILDKLSNRDRRLLREVFFEERDKDEVCRNLGVSRKHLRVLLHRAKKEFKKFYLRKKDDPPLFA